MKKLAAISFLLLLLFNLFGYRILFYYAQQQSDIRFVANLDKEMYNEADLITLKVPLSLPYLTDQKDFERIDGEINVGGKIYKYVKRKVTAGQLVLLCLPDRNKMHLETAKSDFFKSTTDVAQNNSAKKSEKAKVNSFSTLGEYETSQSSDINFAFILKNSRSATSNYLIKLASAFDLTPEQPPEAV